MRPRTQPPAKASLRGKHSLARVGQTGHRGRRAKGREPGPPLFREREGQARKAARLLRICLEQGALFPRVLHICARLPVAAWTHRARGHSLLPGAAGFSPDACTNTHRPIRSGPQRRYLGCRRRRSLVTSHRLLQPELRKRKGGRGHRGHPLWQGSRRQHLTAQALQEGRAGSASMACADRTRAVGHHRALHPGRSRRPSLTVSAARPADRQPAMVIGSLALATY